MKTFVRVFFPILILFGIFLFLPTVPLPESFPEPFSTERNLYSSLIVVCLGIIYLIYILRYMAKKYKAEGAIFDPITQKWGLSSEDYPIYGKHYFGNFKGRDIEVFYNPQRRSMPPKLDVYLTVNTKMRLAVSRKKPLREFADCPIVELNYPEMSDLPVYCENADWAKLFFDKQENRSLVIVLMTGWDKKVWRELYLQPGKLQLYANPYYNIKFQDVEHWFDILPILAEAVERKIE